MPQALPANPNLDWLRKTAKQRLAEMRATSPTPGCTRRSLRIANDYGFKSWRALKAHVDGDQAHPSRPRPRLRGRPRR